MNYELNEPYDVSRSQVSRAPSISRQSSSSSVSASSGKSPAKAAAKEPAKEAAKAPAARSQSAARRSVDRTREREAAAGEASIASNLTCSFL